MIIKQLKVGLLDVFCYIIGCENSKEAIVVDPGGNVDLILNELENDALKVKYIFNTHNHGDHTAGNEKLKEAIGAPIMMHRLDAENYRFDIDLSIERDEIIKIGEISLKTIHTPGHTPGGMCLYTDGNLFAGDTLFVGDSGRTDLADSSRADLGASIRKLMELPEETIVWPGHDYGPTKKSTLAWEKKNNVNAKEYEFHVVN